MANPYPANFVDVSGRIRLSGDVDFTDSGNQPGSGAATTTVTVTTDANTFQVAHIFDLTTFAVVECRYTVTALTPDGEVFGAGAGQTGVGFGSAGFGPASSLDGITFVTGTNFSGWNVFASVGGAGFGITVGDFEIAAGPTPRYFRAGVGIYDNDSGDIYAGANHPQATCRLDVTYL